MNIKKIVYFKNSGAPETQVGIKRIRVWFGKFNECSSFSSQISTHPPRVIQKNIFIIGKYVLGLHYLNYNTLCAERNTHTYNMFDFFLYWLISVIQSNKRVPLAMLPFIEWLCELLT